MKMKQKKVSVIMTVYNQELYLSEAIECIINQTYRNLELIIVDDGSDDNTLNIINKYKVIDDRIEFISRENKGRVDSLNEAIRLSTGQYIAIMDGDDITSTERIEKEAAFLDINREVYLVGAKIELQFDSVQNEKTIKERNRALKISNSELDRSDVFSSINDSFKICHGTWMFRRELFDFVGGYRNYNCEDADFLFRTICLGFKVDRLDEVLLTYRIHGVSRSENKEDLKLDCLKFKTEFLLNEIVFPESQFYYMIWGSDFTGQEGHSLLQKKLPNGKLIAYIDSFKDGWIDNTQVIKPDMISNFNLDYIFICTSSGGEYARKYLNDQGFQQLHDYFKIV